jgi:hypothetical protein
MTGIGLDSERLLCPKGSWWSVSLNLGGLWLPLWHGMLWILAAVLKGTGLNSVFCQLAVCRCCHWSELEDRRPENSAECRKWKVWQVWLPGAAWMLPMWLGKASLLPESCCLAVVPTYQQAPGRKMASLLSSKVNPGATKYRCPAATLFQAVCLWAHVLTAHMPTSVSLMPWFGTSLRGMSGDFQGDGM